MNNGDPSSGNHLPRIEPDPFGNERGRGVRPYLRTSAAGLGAKTPPPALSAALNMRGLLRGVWRNLGIGLGLGLLMATAAAVATWFGMPNSKFSARSMLYVSATPPQHAVSTLDRTPAAGGGAEFLMFQKTQTELLKSRFVLGKALSHPDVAKLPSVIRRPDPIQWLADELSLSFVGELLYIGLESDNPQEVVKLVNAVTGAYLEEVVNGENNRRKKRLDDLKKTWGELSEKMSLHKKNVGELAERAGSNDRETVEYRNQLAMQRASRAEQDLRTLRIQLRDAKIDLATLQAPPQAQPQPKVEMTDDSMEKIEAAVQAALDQDPTVLKYTSQLADLNDTLKGHQRTIRSGNDPAIRKVRSDMQLARDNLKKVYEQRRQSLTAQFTNEYRRRITEPVEVPQSRGNERNLLEKRIVLLQEEESSLVAEVKKFEEGVQSLNQTALSLESTKDEIRFTEKNAEVIGQEVANLEIELRAESRVRPYESAEVPKPSGEKRRLVATGFAAISIFALVLLSVAWLDARVRRIDKVDEVVHGLGMELVGTLPPLSVRSRRALTSSAAERDRNETGILMEAVDSTRALLMHVLRNESIRTVMVASAQKGEGKTSLACHLATSLARARQRTLLIDCDLRCPTIQMLFDLPLGPGVCEILRGESDAADVIQPTSAPLLSLLTAGRCDSSAIEALAHGSLQRLFDAVEGQYDYIIVDSAPVLAVADSLQVCQHVDAVLFSVLRDVSRLPRIHAAYEQLSRLGVRMLGVVVAGTHIEDHGYNYSYQGRAMDASREDAPVSSGKDRR